MAGDAFGFSFSGPEDFEHMMEHIMSKVLGKDAPTSNNPADYPRAEKVEDTKHFDVHDLLLQIDGKQVETNRKLSAAQLSKEEYKVLRTKLFIRLDEMFPHVRTARCGGSGYRRWKGELYYVSWDQADKEDEKDGEKKD